MLRTPLAARAAPLLGMPQPDEAHRPSVALLMAGNPYHNATRCGGCHDAYYALRPDARPENRAAEFQHIFRALAEFARPALYVFHTNTSAWQPFLSDSLVAAVVSDVCPWDYPSAAKAENGSYLNMQYYNLHCSLLLMRAHENATQRLHHYVARMRADYPVAFSPAWFTLEERVLLMPINPLHEPLKHLSPQLCRHPEAKLFPTDQFLLGRRAAMIDALTAMIPVHKYHERYLLVNLMVQGTGFTFVHVAPVVKRLPNGSLADQDMVVNRTGVICRLEASAWARTCTFAPHPWAHTLKYMPLSTNRWERGPPCHVVNETNPVPP